LRREAPEGEVMVVISNMRMVTEKGLVRWLEAVRRADVKHWMVVALDKELRDYCVSNNVPHFFRPIIIPKSQSKAYSSHAISAMKYEILTEFVQLGWSVLLSDVDVVTIKNPWDHLYRDSDVEGMSDGWDDKTAVGEIYGIEDPSMGWSRYAQGYRLMALNSGLFYIRANERVLNLLRLMIDRLTISSDWDQSVYNRYIWTPSHGKYRAPQVSVRIMEPGEFMNSKTLFK
ncbi:nucleotide-diphospho-sugar transferase, partial [Helicosporidium sp. ATCC 50920]